MADIDMSTLSDAQVQAACDLLWSHWQRGTRLAALPDDLRPRTREDGYRIQGRLESTATGPRMGWKIAATSAAGQAHIAVDGPLAGRLLRERVRESGARVPFGTNHMRVAEAEFAFRFGTALPPRPSGYDTPAVLDAVASLHPAIEIPDSRFDDFTRAGAPQLIADNACAHWFVLGPPARSDWRGIDLVTHLAIGRVTGRVEREGCGANVLGDPREALAWLVNELSRLGVTLHAGEVVTTGTCVVPLPIEPGDHVVADFGALGQVEAHVED
jgi:2-keto-4-pentenoate hydratase